MRPADRRAEVWDGPAAPAADLVAKEAQPAEVATPDGAHRDDAATRLVGVRRRRYLDRVAITVDHDDERGVEELAPLSMLAERVDRLEDPAVEADRMTARAQRDPIEIGGSCER
jgi:hypothetical protein